MNAPFSPKGLVNPFVLPSALTLADVLAQLDARELTHTRKRDLQSAVRRVASELGADPAHITVDVVALRHSLKALRPKRIKPQTWSTVRSAFFAALEEVGIKVLRTAKLPRSEAWRALLTGLDTRFSNGLSRFAGFCSANGIQPRQVNDVVLAQFGEALRTSSLASKANELDRDVAMLWNRLAAKGICATLRPLTLPSHKRPPVTN